MRFEEEIIGFIEWSICIVCVIEESFFISFYIMVRKENISY